MHCLFDAVRLRPCDFAATSGNNDRRYARSQDRPMVSSKQSAAPCRPVEGGLIASWLIDAEEQAQEMIMQTRIVWLRRAAVAAVTTGALWLPLQSVAQADQQHRVFVNDPMAARCVEPYRNQFPPCMSTWPEGDPRFHGSQTGPTFSR
jgi:hypothetical protein